MLERAGDQSWFDVDVDEDEADANDGEGECDDGGPEDDNDETTKGDRQAGAVGDEDEIIEGDGQAGAWDADAGAGEGISTISGLKES